MNRLLTGKAAILFTSILTLISVADCAAENRIYYIDNREGNDANNGNAPGTAWKTLDKVSSTVFYPGDQILLKRNETFNGSLILHGSGIKGSPITLSAYGTGERPVIKAGKRAYAVKITDEQYWEISDIETEGGEKAGIFIGCTKDYAVLNHFRITDVYVHNVGNDSAYTFDYSTLVGGIIVANGAMTGNKEYVMNHSAINDVVIDGCTVKYIKRWTCISISSGYGNKGDANYINNCTVAYSVADAIRMNGVKNSYIENCTMYRNGGWPQSPNPQWGGLGAWFFGSDNCTIQYCEASHIDSPHQDGGAFDIDYWQTNSTVQYCYGHDCHGYGVSVFGADRSNPTVNSVVRYNIFSNNGRDSVYASQGDIYVFTWNKGLLNGVKIYNNTSYWNPATDAPALNANADFTGNNPDLFENNIIYSDSSWLVYRKNNALQCDHNIYWCANGKPQWVQEKEKYHSLADWQTATGQDEHSLYRNPMLNNPQYHGNGMLSAQFQPKKNSPAINTGVDMGDADDRDFLGNKIPVEGKYDIGACKTGTIAKVHDTVGVGVMAPDFDLTSVTGEKIALNRWRGHRVLLSFINVRQADQPDKGRETRAQLTFLKSIQRQYVKDALKIILVDASPGKNNRATPEKMLINFIDDNGLKNIPLIAGNREIVSSYRVNILPTTLLIDGNGIISQVWEHTALSSQLAFAMETSRQGAPEMGGQPGAGDWDTHAQTIFPGFGAATPLSGNIWLISGGKYWKKNNYPVRLLVLSNQPVRVQLKAVNSINNESRVLIDTTMTRLPAGDCKILLHNMPARSTGISSAISGVSLGEKGRYTLEAVVYDKENNRLFTGAAHITVE